MENITNFDEASSPLIGAVEDAHEYDHPFVGGIDASEMDLEAKAKTAEKASVCFAFLSFCESCISISLKIMSFVLIAFHFAYYIRLALLFRSDSYLPNDSKRTTEAQIMSPIYLTFISVFSVVGVLGVFFSLNSDQKLKWSIFLFGVIISLIPLAIVIYYEKDFMGPLIYGKYLLSSVHSAVYFTTLTGMCITIPTFVFITDVFHPILKKAGVYKLFCLFGIFCYQASLIVTIHSVVPYTGFGLFVTGVILVATGCIAARVDQIRRLKMGVISPRVFYSAT